MDSLVEIIGRTDPKKHPEIFQKWATKNTVAALVFLNQATFHRAYTDIFNRYVGNKAYFDRYEDSFGDLLKCVGNSDALLDGQVGFFDTVCNAQVYYQLFLGYEERRVPLWDRIPTIEIGESKYFLAMTTNFSSSTGLIGSLFEDKHSIEKMKALHKLEMNAMYLDDAFLKSK